MPFRSMTNTTRMMFHSFLAITDGLGSISIFYSFSGREGLIWVALWERERERENWKLEGFFLVGREAEGREVFKGRKNNYFIN